MRKKAPTAARRRGGGGVTVLRQGFANHTRRRRGVGEGRGCALDVVLQPSHPSTIYRGKGEGVRPPQIPSGGRGGGQGEVACPQARGAPPFRVPPKP